MEHQLKSKSVLANLGLIFFQKQYLQNTMAIHVYNMTTYKHDVTLPL